MDDTKPPPGWEGLLAPGEKILWQGRPDPGFYIPPSAIFTAIFGAAFAAFALFWMSLAIMAGGFVWAFGLLHFTVGLWLCLWAVFDNTLRRRGSWYTLTDRQAFIATDLPLVGRKLKSYPITAETPLDYRPGALSTIYFAKETRFVGGSGHARIRVGFERIPDGPAVMEHFRKIRLSKAAPSA